MAAALAAFASGLNTLITLIDDLETPQPYAADPTYCKLGISLCGRWCVYVCAHACVCMCVRAS
jgi:hypothetical protein